MALKTYREKRDFRRTPEPRGAKKRSSGRALAYVVQKHAARRLHHDWRIEIDGVLESWAVPKSPPTEPGAKALAMQTEPHPLEYGGFEGVIPKGEYGGGTVMLWDRGTWTPEGDPRRGLREGKLSFRIDGERLRGRWTLVRMGAPRAARARASQRAGDRRETGKEWLLIKRSDDEPAELSWEEPERSVASGRTMEEIADAADRVWTSDGEEEPMEEAESRAAADLDLENVVPKLRGARRAALPRDLTPQLATLTADPPEGDEWLHEIKHDGYRLLAMKEAERVRLVTRRGQDWTDRFPRVAAALARLPVHDAIVDGEVVVLGRDGVADFQALQTSFGRIDAAHVDFAFDLPYALGHDLSGVPLVERKELLARILAASDAGDALRYSEHVRGKGRAFHRQACSHALEGIVSKRADARYAARRTRTWVKVKCSKRQELVVVGWTEPSGSREHFGALVLAYRDDDGSLRYCGRVGTGFTRDTLAELAERLAGRESDEPPVVDPPRGANARGLHWVRPELVAEVGFAEWTSDGMLRQPTFVGVREDEPAKEVVREEPADRTATVAGVRLSHPERVLWPDMGVTKRELADYYASVADHVLPHVVGRPLTLVRCPRGRTGKCFYQKHVNEALGPPVRGVPVDESGASKSEPSLYVAIDDLAGLVTLVQLGVLEIHPWGSRAERLEHPDRIVLDVDPAPDVAWAHVVATARVLRERLEALGLESFVRTTGGKGVHVVVPIERRSTWAEVKRFAHDLVRAFERAAPDRYVTTASKAKRRGRIFLDYLRNDRGSTAIASYSSRAHPGAPVATPLRWDELTPRLDPTRYTVRTLPRRLASLAADPWEGFLDARQRLGKAALDGARRSGS